MHEQVLIPVLDALFVVDERDRIVQVNARACELLGASADELVGRRVDEVDGPGELRWDDGDGRRLVTARSVTRKGLLSPREAEVLQLASNGHSTRQIAEALVVSPGTVKTHFEHIFHKLKVSDRATAVAEGLRRGAIT